MALSNNMQVKSEITCFIGTEITMGINTLLDGTWHQVPIIDFSYNDWSSSLTVAPHRSDSFGQALSGAKHLNEDRVTEISLTLKGTAATINRVCLHMFGDGDGGNELNGSSGVGIYKDAVANALPVTILFDSGGRTGNDVYFRSCMCTNMELSYGIDTDGGMLKCILTFMTGYIPTEGTLTPNSSTDAGNGVAFNIHDLTTHTLDSQDLLIKDFSLSIARSVTKGGANPDQDYDPFAYSVGGYEVTGSLTAKRDDKVLAAIDNDSVGKVLSITDGTFNIAAPDVMVDGASISFDDTGYMTTIPFRCFYDDASKTNPVVTITTA